MKHLLLLIIFLPFSLAAQDFSWSKPKYAYAKAYLYNLAANSSDHIIQNGKLHASVADTNGIRLDSAQCAKAINVMQGRSKEQDDVASCFIPHHSIVFYNEKNIPVAWISICFSCGQKRAVPEMKKNADKGLADLKKIIEETKLPVFNHPDEYIKYGKELKGQ